MTQRLTDAIAAVLLTTAWLIQVQVVLAVLFWVFFQCHRSADHARQDVEWIGDALRLYAERERRLPSVTEGLSPLTPHYLERIEDPWGRAYGYFIGREQIVLWSYERDGLIGGEGPDQDVVREFALHDILSPRATSLARPSAGAPRSTH